MNHTYRSCRNADGSLRTITEQLAATVERIEECFAMYHTEWGACKADGYISVKMQEIMVSLLAALDHGAMLERERELFGDNSERR